MVSKMDVNSRELEVSLSLAPFRGKKCKVETGRSKGDQSEHRVSSVWEEKEPLELVLS